MKGKSFGCGQVNIREEENGGKVDRREALGEAVEGDSDISFTM